MSATKAASVAPSMAPRSVCFFNTTPFWGGGEKWHLESAIGFRDRGHRVLVVAAPSSPLLDRARAAGLEVMGIRLSSLSALNPRVLWRLARLFRSHRIEAVIFNGPHDVKAGGLAALIARVPERVYRRGLALPVVNRWLNRFTFRRGLTRILANSEATKRTLLQNLEGAVPMERVGVIYNGIDLEAFDGRPLRPVFERQDGEVVLGNAGRLTAQKGQDFLLRVAERLQTDGVPFRLLIAGEGELEDALRRRIRDLGLEDRVELLGFVEDAPSFLKAIDVFLLSSLWEGFGYVIAEANAAGKPVVAFDVNSNPESIEDGDTGFLVPAGDLEAFAERVRTLIEDPELRRAMGRAARARVEERFQAADKLDELERLLWG